MMKRIFALISVILFFSADAWASDAVVGVVGLGQMGKEIVQCYDKHGIETHAWSRGEATRAQARTLALKNVKVHDKLEEVLASTDLVIMAIMGGADLANAQYLVNSVPSKAWSGKTLVQYSAHDPVSAKEHEKLIKSLGGDLIAGAMLANPEDICGEGMFFVASTSGATIEAFSPTLEKMGTLVTFEGDIGLASLADIGIHQSVYFGLAGLEMSFLLMERYGAPASFQERFLALVNELMSAFFPILAKQVSHVMTTKKWTESVDTKEMVADVFEVQFSFLKKMGVGDDTFLHSYYKYLLRVPNGKDAMSRWTEAAVDTNPSELAQDL